MVDPQEHYYQTLLGRKVAPLQRNGPQSPQVVLDIFVEYLRTLVGETSKMPAQNFEHRFHRPQDVMASTTQLARRALTALTGFRYSVTTSDLRLLLQIILPSIDDLPCLGLIPPQPRGHRVPSVMVSVQSTIAALGVIRAAGEPPAAGDTL